MPDHPGVCPSCGADIKHGWSFCETCGQRLQILPDELNQGDNAGSSQRKRILLVAVSLFLVVCGCLALTGVAYVTRESWFPRIQSLSEKQDTTETQALPDQQATMQLVLQPTIPPVQPVQPTVTSEPTLIPTVAQAPIIVPSLLPPTTQPERFEWQDDFSSMESGWYVYEDSDGYASYHEGFVFAIAVSQPDFELRSWPEIDSSKSQDDAVMSIKAHRVEGEGYWGMICRYTNQDTYYQLAVDEDQFAVFKYLNGSETYLTSPKWISSDSLDPVQYENGMVPIGFNCTGSSVSVTVDGQTVFETSDTSIPNGDVVIYASSYDQEGTVDGYYLKVLFDDFSITLQ